MQYPVQPKDILPELIVCAANQYIDKNKPNEPIILLGLRHGCPMMMQQWDNIDPNDNYFRTCKETQGFWTNKHRFVDRKKAYQIAKKENQIKRLCPTGSTRKFPELFSEMLY